MKKLTNQEINYLLKLLEIEKNGAGSRMTLEVEIAKMDKTEIYFLQQKLENLKN